MSISRGGKLPEDPDIARQNPTGKAPARKDDKEDVKFGGGRFGIGRFSRKHIIRDKKL